MTKKLNWQPFLWLSILGIALVFLVRTDLAHLEWVESFSQEGSPAPSLDESSPTGYELGQRHYLGYLNRGETYRWIEYSQSLNQNGFFNDPDYMGDNVPVGRPQLLPKLYAAWIVSISWIIKGFTGAPLPLCIEAAALWEPVITHAIAFLCFSIFIWRRWGGAAAAAAGIAFALFPLVFGQFLPGSLSPEPIAALLAAYAIAANLPLSIHKKPKPLPIKSAVASSISLALSPIFGFTAIALSAICALLRNQSLDTLKQAIKWAVTGGVVSFVLWLFNQDPWSVEAGELRYHHPFYSFAWLGLGVMLYGIAKPKESTNRKRKWIQAILGSIFVAPLLIVQFSNGYPGWLYAEASMLRATPIQETVVYHNLVEWIAKGELIQVFLFSILPLAAICGLAYRCIQKHDTQRSSIAVLSVIAVGLVLAFFAVRWFFVLSLVSAPIICHLVLTTESLLPRRIAYSLLGVFGFSLVALVKDAPASLQRSGDSEVPRKVDLDALVYRHFAQWMATHHPTRPVSILASPELSDSVIFHGGGKALMSTAWEAYPGQVAASRILSAPESTEAQAVIESRELTHIALSSWDLVIPLLVRDPIELDRDTLHDRLQRWILPLDLRPMPYPLPPIPGYEAEKLALFAVTPPQDEALALARLAEYFDEMKRTEPASLIAESLAEAFPIDPNAAIAQAFVYTGSGQRAKFREQVIKLSRDTVEGIVPTDWDRRVLRAIVLASGKQVPLAKQELEASLAEMTEDSLYDLTPLQIYNLRRVMQLLGLSFPNEEIESLALARSSEYGR